ncbi:HRDC domain-containing protein [Flavobacterium pedocola]
MLIQVFTIRTGAPYVQSDQNTLNAFLDRVRFIKSTAHFVTAEEDQSYWSILIQYEAEQMETKPIREKKPQTKESELTPGVQYVLECLKAWRTDKANQLNLPKYMVCHNSELISIALHQPQTIEALKQIKGIGDKKAEKYGDDIIAVLNAV